MDDQHQRLQAFVKLGNFLRKYCEYANNGTGKIAEDPPLFSRLDEIVLSAGYKNGWFTKKNVLYALEQWGNALNEEQLSAWLGNYKLKQETPKTVAIVMAGNIPLVGFHDFLSVLITGNRALVKLSSDDGTLLPFLAELLVNTESSLEGFIQFEKGRLTNFDAIIATGSNNTARYFEYYFGDKPNIIRKNRVSVAVLSGKETQGMLRALGEDIFRYFGLGCRSVSKLYVPKGYNFDAFFEAIYPFREIIDLSKYANNYDYNKAVYLMSGYQILDNGFLMLKEDLNYGSPIAALFYEHYTSQKSLRERLEKDKNDLQCIVSNGFLPKEVPFGHTQLPGLRDYADGINTVEFLLKTSQN